MKNKKKKLHNKTKTIKTSFSGCNITRYSGVKVICEYLNKEAIVSMLNKSFPTTWSNSRKFGVNQSLLSIILASLCGVNRLSKIAKFTQDGLIHSVLNLEKGINANALSNTLKSLSEKGARLLQEKLLHKSKLWLAKSQLRSITLDADSTVSSVCGNQEGTAKGFNSKKKGAKSYHPLLLFVSELKLLYHSWFRTGSAYTSNGIEVFLQEVYSSLPNQINTVFFRADSGFFSGSLIEQLKSFGWDFLIKVKLKNLKSLMTEQEWEEIRPGIWVCKFDYKNANLKSSLKLKALRSIKEYKELDFFGEKELVPVYEYACYASNLDLDAIELHNLYKQRSTSETWIEQVKTQLNAGNTLTQDFWANDILWQLGVLSYNLSVMMRYKEKKFFKQEHNTFLDWFIKIPGRIIRSGKTIELKMYKHHFYKDDWLKLELLI